MRSAKWIAAFLTVLTAGCIGGYKMNPDPVNPDPGQNNNKPNGPPSPLTARQLFDQKVSPVLQSLCASCHAGAPPTTGPTILGAGPADYYAKLTADARFLNAVPLKSELITQGKHEGPALTTNQATDFETWLGQEIVERGTLPQPPPPANQAQRQLEAFGNCMSLADYTAAGMGDLQNQDTAGSAGNCYSCHSTGMYVYLSTDPTKNYDRLHLVPWLLKLAAADLKADGSFNDIIPANRFRDRGQETGHPSYNLTSARQSALDTFFSSTYTKWKAGGCAAQPGPVDGGTNG